MSFEWYGDEILQTITDGIRDELLTVGADLQDKSVNRAPIDTGKLRESCVVDDTELDNLVVYVGYSAEVDDYSMVQHERLDFRHPRGGEAKYLENPFNENVQQYIDAIGKAVGETIK